jgi:hypothetical protein
VERPERIGHVLVNREAVEQSRPLEQKAEPPAESRKFAGGALGNVLALE